MRMLMELTLRIVPGMLVLGAGVAVLRGRATVQLRVLLYVLAFVLLRDAMTPLGLWRIGVTDGRAFWLRFVDDAVVLVVLAVTSLLVAVALPRLDRDVTVRWGRLGPRPLVEGVAGVAVIVAPVALVGWGVPVAARGGAVAWSLVPAVLLLAFLGNLLEEVLFRGALQGELARHLSPAATVLASGLLFGAGHVFLATTVTDLGWPVLVFTTWEGVVCAWLAQRHGVLAATVAHGGAIAALATGLV